jgi:tetratricopeptide (TPR) repeat protein
MSGDDPDLSCPPSPKAETWYISVGEKQIGPAQPDDLLRLAKRGLLAPDMQVRRSSDDRWMRADEVPGLFSGPSQSSRNSTLPPLSNINASQRLVGPERIVTPVKGRSFPWGTAFVLGFAIIAGGLIGLFAYFQNQKHHEAIQLADEQVFKRLNISIRDFDETQIAKLRPILQGYTADYCDPRSKVTLIRRVSAVGFIQLASRLADDHYEKCAKNLEFLELSYAYNEQLGDYSKALGIINRLIEIDPANATYRFSRGKTYEDTKRFEKALMDYISTLDLLGRPENVDARQFYEIATMYAQLGTFL